MRLKGIFLALVILLLPVTGFSSPTHQLNVGSYSGNGFSASTLHTADGCASNGYNMCGSESHSGITGVLDMTWNSGNSAYTNILGSLLAADGTTVSITGGTLYSSLTNGSWGSLNTNYGTVNFDDLSGFYNGAANNYVNDAFYLWGQTSNYVTTTVYLPPATPWHTGSWTTSTVLSDNQWGLDLYGGVTEIDDSVSVPEPASMGLMALGLMGVVATRRKKKQS